MFLLCVLLLLSEEPHAFEASSGMDQPNDESGAVHRDEREGQAADEPRFVVERTEAVDASKNRNKSHQEVCETLGCEFHGTAAIVSPRSSLCCHLCAVAARAGFMCQAPLGRSNIGDHHSECSGAAECSRLGRSRSGLVCACACEPTLAGVRAHAQCASQ